MTWRLTLHEAWRNLFANKLRSLLAVLGILIGAASVVAMLSIGEMAKNAALAEFQILGTNLLSIDLSVNSNNGRDGVPTFLSDHHWQQLRQAVPTVVTLAPYGLLPAQLAFHGQNLTSTAIDTTPALFSLLRTHLAAGRYLSRLDRDSNYCVIGAKVATQIASNPARAIGQLIQIQNVFFTVVGVLQPWQGNTFFNGNIDGGVILTYDAAIKLPVYVALSSALLRLTPTADIDHSQALIETQISQFNSKVTPMFRSAKVLQQTMSRQKQTLSLMLGLLGSISLLVGGIGIMNVMLVSVTERKKEIGLRLAIGAKQSHIRQLFLTEAAVLGILGGISGSALGLVSTWIISYFTAWHFVLYGLPIAIGLTVSVVTSIFFGFYPAYQAARLNPITVLRAD